MTRQTGLFWRKGLSSVYEACAIHGTERVALEWWCTLHRTGFHSRNSYITRPDLNIPREVGEGKGWAERLAPVLVEPVILDHNRWQRTVAQILESGLDLVSLQILFGEVPYTQDKSPPGAQAEELEDSIYVGNYRGDVGPPNPAWRYLPRHGEVQNSLWRCTLEEAVSAQWEDYMGLWDPPGYLWKIEGEQHGEHLWSWWWGGRDITRSSCPQERKTARGLAWRDFWAEGRFSPPAP